MLRLILLRHAQAAAHAGGGDSERPLTLAGRAEARLMGDYLAAEQLAPDLAVVSDARRARETLTLALEVAGSSPHIIEEPRLYLAEPPTLLELMQMTPSNVRCLLCVGHNPGFHDYALQMISPKANDAREKLEDGLPTAGLIVIDFDAERWGDVKPVSGQLERFVTPDDLR
jgi:phosphohistidine phosphatase